MVMREWIDLVENSFSESPLIKPISEITFRGPKFWFNPDTKQILDIPRGEHQAYVTLLGVPDEDVKKAHRTIHDYGKFQRETFNMAAKLGWVRGYYSKGVVGLSAMDKRPLQKTLKILMAFLFIKKAIIDVIDENGVVRKANGFRLNDNDAIELFIKYGKDAPQ
jgi:hypothetical protein